MVVAPVHDMLCQRTDRINNSAKQSHLARKAQQDPDMKNHRDDAQPRSCSRVKQTSKEKTRRLSHQRQRQVRPIRMHFRKSGLKHECLWHELKNLMQNKSCGLRQPSEVQLRFLLATTSQLLNSHFFVSSGQSGDKVQQQSSNTRAERMVLLHRFARALFFELDKPQVEAFAHRFQKVLRLWEQSKHLSTDIAHGHRNSGSLLLVSQLRKQ